MTKIFLGKINKIYIYILQVWQTGEQKDRQKRPVSEVKKVILLEIL
jgi:hypothetical protein